MFWSIYDLLSTNSFLQTRQTTNPMGNKKKKNKKVKSKGNNQVDKPIEKSVCPGDGEWISFY